MPGQRGAARRQPSVKCTLRTKNVPHGVKSSSLQRNHNNELWSVLHKRALRASKSPPDENVSLTGDPPDSICDDVNDQNQNGKEDSNLLNKTPNNTNLISENADINDEAKENKRLPPKVRPKPKLPTKNLSQDELTISIPDGDTKSVKDLRDQLTKLLSPATQEPPSLKVLQQNRRSKGNIFDSGSSGKPNPPPKNVSIADLTDLCQTNKSCDDSDNRSDFQLDRNSLSIDVNPDDMQRNRSPSPRTKTANVAAMFESKFKASSIDQPNPPSRSDSPNLRTPIPSQKPLLPNKPKSQVPHQIQSDSSNDNKMSTNSSEVLKRPGPTAKPAVPRKSMESAKIAELRKSLTGAGNLVMSLPKPNCPVKPAVAGKPKVDKNIVNHTDNLTSKSPTSTVSPLSPKLKSSSSPNMYEKLIPAPDSSESECTRLVTNSNTNSNICDSGDPSNQAGSRLSSASTGSKSDSNLGSPLSGVFDKSIDFDNSYPSHAAVSRTPSNSSSGSSQIPEELLADTVNFSGASRFVSSPWKQRNSGCNYNLDLDDNEGRKENVYGDLWNCKTALPKPPSPRDDYEEVDLEYEDMPGKPEEGLKRVFTKLRNLVRKSKQYEDCNWKDCEGDTFDSNPMASTMLKIRIGTAQAKARSLRRSVLNRKGRNRPPSYDDVYVPGEENDSEGWMTDSDSDSDDFDDYYEEIDSEVECDLDQKDDNEGQRSQEPVQERSPDPVPPPRRKSVELKEAQKVNRSSSGLGSISEGDLDSTGSRSNEKLNAKESRSNVKELCIITPKGSSKSPMAAVMGQLSQALKLGPKRDSKEIKIDRNSKDLKDTSDTTNLNRMSASGSSGSLQSLPSLPNSPDFNNKNQDFSRPDKNKDSLLSLPQLRTSLSASPSSVSASSVSSTSSTSSSSSSSFSSNTPVPSRPAPKPPSHLARKSLSNVNLVRHHSDTDDNIPSSGYSSESDNNKQSRDSNMASSATSQAPPMTSQSKEQEEQPELPPTLPPRKRISKASLESKDDDKPPALPPPRIRLPNPQSVSTSKDAMFPRSRSPEKIYQGEKGQGEGQTIPDINSNVQNAEDFVNSFITIRGDRYDAATDESTTDEPQTKTSRGSSVDSDGNNYLELLDEQVPTQEADVKSPFINEPLYQIYHCGVVARNVWESNNDFQGEDETDPMDTLEEGDIQSVCGTLERMAIGENASETELHATLQKLARGSQNFRTLWCEMPEVQKLGVLESMTQKEKRFQESLFEIITSEASYLKSLSIFLAFFADRPGIKGPHAVISESERKELFSNFVAIKEVSKRFMNDMESRWKKDPMLTTDLCEIISDYANGDFNAYVNYCANLVFQERKLRKLRETNERFQQLVAEFEARPECKSLPIDTFLTLPMQRITRMPLLVDAVCQRTEPETPEYRLTRKALVQLQKLVRTCNERARQIANIEQNTEIDRSLDFKKMKKMPIVSQSKSLVKKGKLTRIFKENKGFLGNKRKESLYLFLFNDTLIIAKRKNTNPSNETRSYQVVDYASRNAVEATEIDGSNFSKWLPNGVPSGCQNLFILALVDNHEHRHAEFCFSCDSLSDRTRWVEAVTPVSENDDEKIYEDWDCPQVQAIHRYVARQPDELTLEESDVINVTRKIADGWFEGERIRDGERGWFPGNHTVEIQSPHVRAKNLKQRYRLLTITEHFLLDSSTSSNYASKA